MSTLSASIPRGILTQRCHRKGHEGIHGEGTTYGLDSTTPRGWGPERVSYTSPGQEYRCSLDLLSDSVSTTERTRVAKCDPDNVRATF